MKTVKFCSIVLLLILSLCISAIAFNCIVLAEEYPYANTFLQMARRSAADFCAVTQSHPEGIEILEKQGYSPYLFPETTRFDVSFEGDKVLLYPQSSTTYGDGIVYDSYYIGAKIKGTELTKTIQTPIIVQGDGGAVVDGWEGTEIWNFRGAEWLADGYGWYEVEHALKLDRIVTHLAYVARDYQYDSGGTMATTIDELEEYVGVARNPVCWEGVELVSSPADVEFTAGGLFVGWDGRGLVISGNLGPEVLTYRLTYDGNQGLWKTVPHLGAY